MNPFTRTSAPDRSHSGFLLRSLRNIQARMAFGVVVTGLIAAVAVIVPTAAQAATASPATVSSAANVMGSYVPGDFSPYFPTTIRYVDDCTVELGPVYDSVPSPNYHKIGGVRVNCSTVHSVIAATVWEMYWNGNTWVRWGSSNSAARYNQSGSGYGLNGILRSPPVCFGTGNRGYWWITGALVQTERTGMYVYSDMHQDPSGC
jgi:hypothetical protein